MRLPKFTLGLLAFLLAAVFMAACGSSGTPNATATTVAPAGGGTSGTSITIHNYAFSPAKLTVKPGATITVHNEDSVAHTVTDTGKFDTGDVASGATKSFTAPSTPGTYSYMCTIHPFMMGTLTVS